MAPKRSPAHYLWTVLLACIDKVFALLCPMFGGQMRRIAFITEGAQIKKILDRCGLTSPSHIPGTRATPVGWV